MTTLQSISGISNKDAHLSALSDQKRELEGKLSSVRERWVAGTVFSGLATAAAFLTFSAAAPVAISVFLGSYAVLLGGLGYGIIPKAGSAEHLKAQIAEVESTIAEVQSYEI